MAATPPYQCPVCEIRGWLPRFINHAEGCPRPMGVVVEPSFVLNAIDEKKRRARQSRYPRSRFHI